MNKKFIKGLFLSEFEKLTEANFCTHDSIPDTLMPEGNKSRVSGDGLALDYTNPSSWSRHYVDGKPFRQGAPANVSASPTTTFGIRTI